MILDDLKDLEVVNVTAMEEVTGGSADSADFTDPFGRYLF